MSIERLDPHNTADVNAVADLHLTYLSDSPIVKLGDRFLRSFFYRQLIDDGLVGCTICRAHGRVVGFISYTCYPLDFMTRGLRKHFFTLAWLMLGSVVARPATVKDIFLVLRMMSERDHKSRELQGHRVGEGISIATAPEYRDYIPPGATSRMSGCLWNSMVEYFRREHVEKFYVLVEPSNRASNIFCTRMGAQLEKVTRARTLIHRYTYLLTKRNDEGHAVSPMDRLAQKGTHTRPSWQRHPSQG